MHSMDIIINTLIVLLAIQAWTIIGYALLSMIDDYELEDSGLLTCFFWMVIIIYIIDLKITGDQDDSKGN